MEVEKISSVNANYSSSSEMSRSETEARSVDAGATAVKQMAHASTTTVVQSGMTGEEKQESGQQQRERAASEATIDDAVRSANRKMDRTRCEYSYHKKTNRVSIKVLDEDTGEVIREIPPEKSLDMLQKMWEMAGILVDERR